MLIHTPSDSDILTFQQHEQSFYWSACFENLLRKYGVIPWSCESEASAYRIYRGLRQSLYKRLFVSCCKIQDFKFDQKYSVISAFSSLLYVPKDQRIHALDLCWEYLAPGGVLVIFEAMKTDLKNKDYAVQFSSEEIDAILGKFGQIHRIGVTEICAISAVEAKENSVFRFVVKQ